MREVPDYPWEQVAPYAARAAAHPGGKLDLSIGSPVDPVPESIQHALRDSGDAHGYPVTSGTAELREAIAAWYARRRGVTVTADAVLPTVGSKELVALLPFLLGLGQGDTVVYPEIAYPTYAIGAQFAGATGVAADDPADWPDTTKLVWLNSPANPHGRVLSVTEMRERVAAARALGAVVASDECYAELGWDAPWDRDRVPCVLDPRVSTEHTGLLSVYSLSKQSNMAGYRAAWVCGDTALIKNLTTVRKHAGLIVPFPVQQAMLAALADDTETIAQKARYAARRTVLLAALQTGGWEISDSEAGLYLWARRSGDCWQDIAALADIGIVAGPGAFYGAAGADSVRFALSASDADIHAAAARIAAAKQ